MAGWRRFATARAELCWMSAALCSERKAPTPIQAPRWECQGNHQRHASSTPRPVIKTGSSEPELQLDLGFDFYGFVVEQIWLVTPLAHCTNRRRNQQWRTADYLQIAHRAILPNHR